MVQDGVAASIAALQLLVGDTVRSRHSMHAGSNHQPSGHMLDLLSAAVPRSHSAVLTAAQTGHY